MRELCALWQYTVKDLQEVITNPRTNCGRLVIARILLMAGEGDAKAREVLLERLLGKVADKLDITESLESLIAGARAQNSVTVTATPAKALEGPQALLDAPGALPEPAAGPEQGADHPMGQKTL